MAKTIQVMTNDTQNKRMILKMSGQVAAFAIIEPRLVRLTGKIGEELQGVVNISPADGQDFDITGHHFQNGDNLGVTLEKIGEAIGETTGNKTAGEKKQWKVTITNTSKNLGRYYDVLSLKTNSRIQPELKIRVFGNIIK